MTLAKLPPAAGLWASGGQVVIALAAFARSVVLARMLGPAPLGRVFLMLSATATLATVGQTGLAVVGLKRIAAADDASVVAETLSSVRDLTLGVNLALLACTTIVLLNAGLPRWQVASFGLLMTTQLWIGLLAALVRGRQQIARALVHEQVIAPLMQLGALVAWAAAGRPATVAGVLALCSFALVPSILVLAASLRNARRPIGRGVSRSHVAILKDAVPVVGTALVWRALADVPLWTAGVVVGEAGIAVFAIAQRVAAIVSLPLAGTGAVLAPRAAALFARGEYRALEAELRSAALVAALGAACALGALVAGGRAFLTVAYGERFVAALPIAAVLGLGHVFNAAAGVGGFMLITMDESPRLLRLSVAVMAGLVAIVLPLGVAFGLVGLACAWLIAMVLQNLGMIRAVRRLSGIRVYSAWP